jgi:hypothetical protein
LETGEVSVHGDKAALAESGEPLADLEMDLFDRWALLHFLSQSAVSSQTVFNFQQDGHTFEFQKEPGFSARSLEGLGVQDTPLGLSVGPYLLSVRAAPGT